MSRHPNISKLFLLREQYAEVNQKYGRGVITLEIENNHQHLFYFGANHSPNPADPQYPALREYWARFLKETDGQKDRIVLIEGGLRRLETEEERAIRTGSEGSLVTMFAREAGIPIASPDISDEEIFKQLSDNSREETLLYWFLSFADNWRRHPEPRPGFDERANHWITVQKERFLWKDLEISSDKIKEIYKDILGKKFDLNDDFNSLIDPNRTGTRINQIARSHSDLRDVAIASEIERYWNEGKSIFAVFGKGHLMIQEPALRKVLS